LAISICFVVLRQVFKGAVEKFVKARPREWLKFSAFRASGVEVNLGYVEYFVAATHREGWQQIGALLQSKADLSSFALELQKRMDIRYRAPPLPVDLSMTNRFSLHDSSAVAAAAAPAPVTNWNILQENMEHHEPLSGRNEIITEDE
jgi:hypothetical protein